MKKVLFIGQFNNAPQMIQKYLSRFVSLQLCSDNVSIAASMVGIYGPDLVLVNVNGFGEGHIPLFENMAEAHGAVPMVIFGEREACQRFAVHGATNQITVVTGADFTEKNVLEAVMGRVDIGAEIKEDGSVAVRDERKMVLVVDDSPVILRSVKQMLDKKYQVALATSGPQAIEMIDKRMPDLIILDYEMPECDGRQTLEMIRGKEESKDLPVVFLTGHGDSEHIRSVLDLNPSAYFLKPPKADKIMEILGKLL